MGAWSIAQANEAEVAAAAVESKALWQCSNGRGVAVWSAMQMQWRRTNKQTKRQQKKKCEIANRVRVDGSGSRETNKRGSNESEAGSSSLFNRARGFKYNHRCCIDGGSRGDGYNNERKRR